MEGLTIQPVLASAIPEIAAFLHKQDVAGRRDSPVPRDLGGHPRDIESRLEWLLAENPLASSGSPSGYAIRDGSGAIAGLLLCFPAAFLAGGTRVMGLGSGAFFVEPHARTLGFYLFKKYLSLPGYALFFSTSCNRNSAALWARARGRATPGSNVEYVFPLRLHKLLPALVSEGISSGVASAVGRCGDAVMRMLERRPANLSLEPCRDWDKLSRLFRRLLPADCITADRTPEFLEWRYGRSSDAWPCGAHLIRDRAGNEGWLALCRTARGRRPRVRGAVLLDVFWPRERIAFGDILDAVVRLAAQEFDVLSVRHRPGIDWNGDARFLIRRRLPAPANFVIHRTADAQTFTTALDLTAVGDNDLPPAPVLASQTTAAGDA